MKDHDLLCTLLEKERLVEKLRECEYSTTSLEEHDKCRRKAAQESGQRLKD